MTSGSSAPTGRGAPLRYRKKGHRFPNGQRRESPVGREAPRQVPFGIQDLVPDTALVLTGPPASGPTSGHLAGTPGRIQYRGDSVPPLACRPSIDDAPVLSAPGGDVLLDSTQSAAARGPGSRSCPALPGGTSQTVTVASGEADAIHISASQHEPTSPAGQVVARTPPPGGLRRAAAAPSAQPGPG